MKIIVVEDEAVIRKGIINKVNWEKCQVNQVLEADNGETAYEIIVKEKPDIVLLDICLPKLNGIELLKRMRLEGIRSKAVILSGHDEFEYAQQAITYGVENYLLKPSYAGEIEEIISKVSSEIISDSEKEKKNEELKKRLEEMIPFFKSGLINNVITSNITSENDVINLSAYLNIDIKSEFYIVAVLLLGSLPGYSGNMEKELISKIEISQLIKEVIGKKPALIDDTLAGKVIILMTGNNDAELKKDCFSTINRIFTETAKITSVPITVGIGKVYKEIKNIKYSYGEALSAIENRFVDSENRIYYIGDIILENYDLRAYPYEDEKQFLNYIKLGKQDSASESLSKLIVFLKAEKDRYPVNLIKTHLNQLVYYMVQIVYELGGVVSDLLGNINVMELTGSFSHIDEYEEFVNSFAMKLCDYIAKKRYIKHNSIMRKILIYIEENYSDVDLGLEQISEYVSMHPNYVSHLFKKEKGESLTSYICQLRVKKSQELIVKSQSFKIGDVAYEVGFNDSHYFTTCFKNIVGVTPTEFKTLSKT